MTTSRVNVTTSATLRALVLSLVGLAASLSAATAAEQIKIGISRTISDAGYYIADAKGFFREEGLEVSIIGFNSAAQMIAPLGTGELEVGGGTVSAGVYNAVGRGILIRIVADQASIKPGYGYSSLMVRKDLVDSGRYKTFADLKGMKVAIGAPGTGTASALNEALKKGGLKYSDVDVVYIGFPEHLPTYRNKGIDASITNEPTMTRAIEEGVAVRIAGNDVTYPDQQTAVTFFSDHLIRTKRDAAERFMRAYLRGVRLYNDALKDGKLAGPKAGEVIPILVKYTTIKDESMFRRMIPSWCNPDGEVNVASLKKDLEFFRALGLIEKKDASVEAVVDSSFAKAAVAKLGPPALRAPNGSVQDSLEYWSAGKSYYDPAKITAPTLLVLGEWDSDTPPYMAQTLFPLLTGSAGKRLVVLAEGSHAMYMEKYRLRLFEAVQSFLDAAGRS